MRPISFFSISDCSRGFETRLLGSIRSMMAPSLKMMGRWSEHKFTNPLMLSRLGTDTLLTSKSTVLERRVPVALFLVAMNVGTAGAWMTIWPTHALV